MHILVLDSIFASTETNLDISINHAYPRIEKSLQNTNQEYDSRTYRIISFIVQYCVIGSRLYERPNSAPAAITVALGINQTNRPIPDNFTSRAGSAAPTRHLLVIQGTCQ